MMKKRKSITELIDGILEKKDTRGESARDVGAFDEAGASGETDHLARLGEAFIARLNIPKGMDVREAVERIIAMWNDADALRASREGGSENAAEDVGAHESEELGEKLEDAPATSDLQNKRSERLPTPIRGGLFDAPRADYESMSAEQFRRLKKQLERASMDGRKIRL